MKRLQIMIEEELDQALALKAEDEGRSKAAIIREIVGAQLLRPLPPLEDDPLWKWATEGEEGEVGDIDAVVYDKP